MTLKWHLMTHLSVKFPWLLRDEHTHVAYNCICVCVYTDVKCAGAENSVLMSPEQGVFGYGSIDLLAGDDEDDAFSPWVLALLHISLIGVQHVGLVSECTPTSLFSKSNSANITRLSRVTFYTIFNTAHVWVECCKTYINTRTGRNTEERLNACRVPPFVPIPVHYAQNQFNRLWRSSFLRWWRDRSSHSTSSIYHDWGFNNTQ